MQILHRLGGVSNGPKLWGYSSEMGSLDVPYTAIIILMKHTTHCSCTVITTHLSKYLPGHRLLLPPPLWYWNPAEGPQPVALP